MLAKTFWKVIVADQTDFLGLLRSHRGHRLERFQILHNDDIAAAFGAKAAASCRLLR